MFRRARGGRGGGGTRVGGRGGHAAAAVLRAGRRPAGGGPAVWLRPTVVQVQASTAGCWVLGAGGGGRPAWHHSTGRGAPVACSRCDSQLASASDQGPALGPPPVCGCRYTAKTLQRGLDGLRAEDRRAAQASRPGATAAGRRAGWHWGCWAALQPVRWLACQVPFMPTHACTSRLMC